MDKTARIRAKLECFDCPVFGIEKFLANQLLEKLFSQIISNFKCLSLTRN